MIWILLILVVDLNRLEQILIEPFNNRILILSRTSSVRTGELRNSFNGQKTGKNVQNFWKLILQAKQAGDS